MRKFLRGAAFGLALVLAGVVYIVYQTVWGTPLRIDDLLDRQVVVAALDSPQTQTWLGVADGEWYDLHSGRLDDYSLEAREKRFARIHDFYAEIAEWSKASLTPPERLSCAIARWDYGRGLADEKYPWLGANNQLYPVNQVSGVQIDLPIYLLATHQITNVRLARHYVERLKALGPTLDAVRDDVARQADDGVIAPDFVIDASIDEMKTVVAPVAGENPLIVRLAERTAAIGMDGAERDELINQAIATMLDTVYPAYRRMIAEQQSLRARASHDAGVWRLKDGDAYYADQLKTLTATNLTPDEIRAYGLGEVARITAEADAVLKSAGLTQGTVGERLAALMSDPRFLYPDSDAGRTQALTRYEQILGRARMMLPKYFSHIPKVALEVRRAPAFAETGWPGAEYAPPSLGGGRPGVMSVNLRDMAATPMWAMPALVYQEGVPGRHLQAATALTNTDLPFGRRIGSFTAYDEGWALYAGRLAKELGLYDGDPYADLGRLRLELIHAARLVADTGIHAKRWSREQAIAYLQATTGMTNSEAAAEVAREAAEPGRACAAAIGLKTILDLRRRAESELGAKFDLKKFHAEILENGAMPLGLLSRDLDRWIAREKRASAASPGTH